MISQSARYTPSAVGWLVVRGCVPVRVAHAQNNLALRHRERERHRADPAMGSMPGCKPPDPIDLLPLSVQKRGGGGLHQYIGGLIFHPCDALRRARNGIAHDARSCRSCPSS